MHTRRLWTGYVVALLGALSVVIAPGLAAAQSAGGTTPDARALLFGMADFLAKTPRMTVTIRGAYDAVQASGQKIEWNEIRSVTLSRPDRLRVEGERSNGARTLVVFDGKEISTFDESGRVYAQAPQPGGIDEGLVYFVRDLGMRMPLAVLFLGRASAELEQRVRAVSYVEKTGILGAPAHHIAGRTDSVDFQLWIADGDRPLPQRIVLSYRSAPGQPQFWATFSNWNLAAQPAESLFSFAPPAGATRIPFATALSQLPVGAKAGAAAKAPAAKKGAQP